MLEHLFGLNKLEVQLQARWRRLHRSREHAQRLVRLTRLCTASDLCATTMAQEVVNPRWIAFNVDTGAGGTVADERGLRM